MAKWRRHSVEFKRQAVERMKGCDNLHALALELKVQRKLLYTWKYQMEGRPEPRHANLAESAERRQENQLSGSKRPWERRLWRSIFSKVPCAGSRKDARTIPLLARRHLRRNPSVDRRAARQTDGGADVPIRAGEPGRILPAPGGEGAGERGYGGTGCDPESGVGAAAAIRLPAHLG
jgi:transposase-like protein